MSATDELQNIISDISVSIAGREPLGRVDQEKLRRRLTAALAELRSDARAGVAARMALSDLCLGIDRGVGDLVSLAQVARAKLPEAL